MEETKIKKIRVKKIETSDKPVEKKPEVKVAKPSSENKLIAIVRIKGEVEIRREIVETLFRLRLRKKYSCTLINSNNKGLMGMLDKVKHHVAYGEIDEKTLVDLLKARLQSTDHKKFSAEDVAESLMKGKNLTELGFKGFFRLHPPRKGIDSKKVYPKGALGNHGKKINELVERML
jgi:large subunit ribosomal protein L30